MSGPVHSIAYNGTTYVRVGNTGLIQTSTNAIDWTIQASPESNHLYGVTYGNGLFVICGGNGVIMYSADEGVTWSTAVTPTSEELYAITFADIFIAVGSNGYIQMSSSDAQQWAYVPSGTTEHLYGVDHGDGYFIATGDDDIIVIGEISSTDTDVTVTEALELNSELTNNWAGSETVSETMYFRERPFHDEEDLQFWEWVEDGLFIDSGQIEALGSYNITIGETMNILQRLFISNEIIRETLAMGDVLDSAYKFMLTDGFSMDDTTSYNYNPVIQIVDQLAMDDTPTPSLVISVEVEDSILLTDSVVNSMTLSAVINETVSLSTAIGIDVYNPTTGNMDHEIWTGYVVNTKNLGISEYVRFDFNSFAEFNNKYYGANEKGIYELDGDTDDGWLIKALVTTGLIDFGNEFQKKLPRMYLGLRNDGKMRIK
jgi:hypothetical protein